MKHTPLGLLIFSIVLLVSMIGLAWLWPFLRSNSLSAEAYAAIAGYFSVVVAAMALYLSWYQIQSAEKSARLSVKPHCVLISVISNFDKVPVGVHLRNNGLGPAIIVEWSFTVDGRRMEKTNEEGLSILAGRYGLFNIASGMLLPPGSSLGANQTEKMIAVPWDLGVTEVSRGIANVAMERMMREVDFILRFKSAYGEEQSISLHSHRQAL